MLNDKQIRNVLFPLVQDVVDMVLPKKEELLKDEYLVSEMIDHKITWSPSYPNELVIGYEDGKLIILGNEKNPEEKFSYVALEHLSLLELSTLFKNIIEL